MCFIQLYVDHRDLPLRTPSLPKRRCSYIAWWREALEKLHQPPLPGEPVLQALAHEVTGGDAAKCAALAALTDGWLTLIEAETVDTTTLEAHAEQPGERLLALAAELTGADNPERALRQLGEDWRLVALARLLSRHKDRAHGGGEGAHD